MDLFDYFVWLATERFLDPELRHSPRYDPVPEDSVRLVRLTDWKLPHVCTVRRCFKFPAIICFTTVKVKAGGFGADVICCVECVYSTALKHHKDLYSVSIVLVK